MIGCTALNGGGDNLPRKRVGVFFELRFNLLDLDGGFVPDIVLNTLEDIGLCLLLAQTGDLFQHFQLALFDGCDLFLLRLHVGDLLGEVLFLLFVDVQLFVERLFLLLQTALLFLQLASAFFEFLFVLGTRFMDLFLCFKQHFALLVLAALDGFIDDAFCLFLGAADLFLSDVLAVCYTDNEEYDTTHDETCDAKNQR